MLLPRLGALVYNKIYWIILILFSALLLGTALFYQYALDEWPCVLCIHVRILLVLLLLISLPGLIFHLKPKTCLFSQILVVLLMGIMLNRSWRLFGTEHGLIEGDCSISLGLPEWLALDQWFPNIFEVWTSCGYTPELALGVTMAEVLLVLSAAWLLLSILILIALIREQFFLN